jgi:hypothetical protein
VALHVARPNSGACLVGCPWFPFEIMQGFPGAFCFSNSADLRHFKTTSWNADLARIPARHWPVRSFTIESVLPALSPLNRTEANGLGGHHQLLPRGAPPRGRWRRDGGGLDHRRGRLQRPCHKPPPVTASNRCATTSPNTSNKPRPQS